MSNSKVNSASIANNSAGATAYTVAIPAGTGIQAGDLIVAAGASNFAGTRVSNDMKLQDSVNKANYTTISETQQGGNSSHWMQTFYYVTPKAIPDGSVFTFTPKSGSTINAFAVDIYRGSTGAITKAVVIQSNTAGTNQGAPALGSAPSAGNLVLTFDAASSGTLTVGTPFTAGSANEGSGGIQSVAIGYVLSADGSSTYASTWTDSSTQTSATQTVAFGGSPSSISVTTTSPLPDAVQGTPYSDALAATGGVQPLSWALNSGSLPAGLSLLPGGAGTAPIQYIGANTGPQGAPTEAAFASAQSILGPLGCQKVFYSSGGSGIYTGALPTTWSGSLADQITSAFPGVFIYISWGELMTQTQINSFVDSIPDTDANGNQMVVGFSYQSEPENAYPQTAAGGAQFVSDWTDQAVKIRNAAKLTGARLLLVTSHYMPPYISGSGGVSAIRDNGVFIPPPTNGGGVVLVDYYGADFYQHEQAGWAATNMGNDSRWSNWVALTSKLGPLALTEYGISYDATKVTDAQGQATRNQRIQADWAYLQTAFGAGGSIRTDPMLCWLYWENGISGGASTKYLFTDSATEATWKSIVQSAGIVPGQPISSGSGGGVISGTPTTPGTSTFTVKVTDATGATATSGSLSLTVDASGSLSVATNALPDGTENADYSTQLLASGGTLPYSWAISSGALPVGLALDPSTGIISGTPTATGTFSFVVQVTDSASPTPATATANLSITVAGGVTVTTTTLPPGTLNAAYDEVLGAAGGVSPYTWAMLSGALPAGLTLDPDGSLTGTAGTISGTPTQAGVFNFSVQVTDSSGFVGTQSLVLTIAQAGGGLTDPGRRVFGGMAGAQVIMFSGSTVERAPNVPLQYYDSISGGTQYTDLETMGGTPITSVTGDSNGFPPQFKGPADVLMMYEDANGGAGPRRAVFCDDIGDLIMAMFTALQGVVGA